MTDFLFWVVLAYASGQTLFFLAHLLWMIWVDAIEPRRIPSSDIERAARELVANYSDPEGEAYARQERARHRAESAEQTYWRRVRKAVIGQKTEKCIDP